MPSIGVRELHEKTGEVLRQVRERQAEYVITYQGRPVALLLPVNTEVVEAKMLEASKQNVEQAWQNYEQLANELRKEWSDTRTTQEIMDEIRGR
jgi:prevent-host-death family protein